MESIIVNKQNIQHVLSKTTSVQNSIINVLSGSGEICKPLFKTDEAYRKAFEKEENTLSWLGFGDQQISVREEKRALYDKEKMDNIRKGKENGIALTKNERYLLMFLLATHTQNDEELRPVEINIEIAEKLFYNGEKSTDVDYINILKRSAKVLMRKQFRYFDGLDMNESQILVKASNISIDNGRAVKLKLNQELHEFFVSHKKGNYTSVVFLHLMNIKPKSQALYLVLKRDDGIMKARKGYRVPLYMTKEEILKHFNSKSKNFAAFKRDVLVGAIKDINDNSDITIDFHECLAQERRDNSTKIKKAELYFKIAYKDDSDDMLKGLMLAKQEIIAKGKFVKSAKSHFAMKDFNMNKVIKDTVSITLIVDKGEEIIQVPVEDMIHEYKNTIRAKINEIKLAKDTVMPGAGENTGLETSINMD